MRLALYQPDIPPNVGTMLRLSACLGLEVDIIEPCGFPFNDRSLQRAGMDYMGKVTLDRHDSWEAFLAIRRRNAPSDGRLILLTTKSDLAYTDMGFLATDTLLVGQESSGVPDSVRREVNEAVSIPMVDGVRSLNVAVAAAMVIGEALRQTGLMPDRD